MDDVYGRIGELIDEATHSVVRGHGFVLTLRLTDARVGVQTLVDEGPAFGAAAAASVRPVQALRLRHTLARPVTARLQIRVCAPRKGLCSEGANGGGREGTSAEARVPLFDLPVMVGSSLCPPPSPAEGRGRGSSGAFIINGVEHLFVSQERRAHDTVFVYPPPRSEAHEYLLSAEVRSSAGGMFRLRLLHATNRIAVDAPNRPPVEVGLLLAALGVHDPREVVRRVARGEPVLAEAARRCICSSRVPKDRASARELLKELWQRGAPAPTQQRRPAAVGEGEGEGEGEAEGAEAEEAEEADADEAEAEEAEEAEDGEADGENVEAQAGTRAQAQTQTEADASGVDRIWGLGHLRDEREKADLVAYMCRRLLLVFKGRAVVDDCDSQLSKRLWSPGMLFEELLRATLRSAMGAVVRDLNKQLTTAQQVAQLSLNVRGMQDPVVRAVRARMERVGVELATALATGNGLRDAKGLTLAPHLYNPLASAASASQLRDVTFKADTGAQSAAARQLRMVSHMSHGRTDVVETPDGSDVGVVKHLSLGVHVTGALSAPHALALRRWLAGQGVFPTGACACACARLPPGTLVSLDGVVVGVHADGALLAEELRALRRAHPDVLAYVSVALRAGGELHVRTDAGRLCRMLMPLHHARTSTAAAAVSLVPSRLAADLQRLSADVRPLAVAEVEALLGGLKAARQGGGGDGDGGGGRSAAFVELLRRGIVEMVDADEESTLLLARAQADCLGGGSGSGSGDRGGDEAGEPTHCELRRDIMLSAVSATMPFVNSNQAPRAMYGAAHAKQAMPPPDAPIGRTHDALKKRDVLVSPQTAQVTTGLSRCMGSPGDASGATPIVAIMVDGGGNQEDAVIINKAVVERGLLAAATETTRELEVEAPCRARDLWLVPIGTGPLRAGAELAAHTPAQPLLPQPGAGGEEARTQQQQQQQQQQGAPGRADALHTDRRVVADASARAERARLAPRVMRVAATDPQGGYVTAVRVARGLKSIIVSVTFSTMRELGVGDKMSSHGHGQKHVVGVVMQAHDMPYTHSGVTPDIIINPHAFPSRMTPGMLIEALVTKATIVQGKRVVVHDPWEDDDLADPERSIDALVARSEALLRACGYSASCKETLVDGKTGREIASPFFMFPLHLQRLKHMVSDRVQTRGLAASLCDRTVDPVTQQPLSGRANSGGMRLGEMEVDAVHCHGAAYLLQDMSVMQSDASRVHIDRATGLPARLGDRADQCSSVACVPVPHAFKLLLHELAAQGIQMRVFASGETPGGENRGGESPRAHA
jgi:DNA-directed RNA polymerase beta subunit